MRKLQSNFTQAFLSNRNFHWWNSKLCLLYLIQNSATVEQTLFGEVEGRLVERQEEMRKNRRSIRWNFDSEHRRCIHCYFRWNWNGMHNVSVRILVVQISKVNATDHKCS